MGKEKSPMPLLAITLVILLTLSATGHADEIAVSNFATEGLRGWEPKSFKGRTEYRLVEENGRTVVRATSHAAASGLVQKLKFDPARYRYLRWSWKTGHTVPGGDERTKAGDDYAARVYVVFSGRFFWQTKAINYIWANRLKKGDAVPNAFSAHVQMLAVESGVEKAGEWQYEERDILADYRRLFGEEPSEAVAVAIMTDTDNTGGSAEAWYGEIRLATER